MEPAPPSSISPEEAAANRRAMPLQRLLSNGMEWADAHELHARSVDLEPWHVAGRIIGDRTRARARAALAAGHRRTAAECFKFASAAYRFGQNPLPDGAEKRALYHEMITAYGEGAEIIGGIEHVTVPTALGPLHAWLHRPTPAPDAAPPPIVLVLGGFDGWREEYDTGARRLVDAGFATLLIDGPGQGETRLFAGVPMPADPTDWSAALGQVITWAQNEAGFGAVGVWGNSFGGHLAARLAADDPRVRAACINGGTDRPAEILDRFPRFVSKVQALFAEPDPDAARALLDRHHLDVDDLCRIEAPTLILHGDPDQIFLIGSANRLAEHVSGPSTLRTWPDGDHCLYNHGHERDTTVADWFADQLGAESAHGPQATLR